MGRRKDVGGRFEDRVRDVFKEMQKRNPLKMERLYDTKTAGKMVPNQEGDFKGTAIKRGDEIGTPWLIECKASEKHTTLRSCLSVMVSKKREQVAHHRLWRRAGGRALYLFYSEPGDILEIWDSEVVCENSVSGKPLPEGSAITVTHMKGLEQALKEILL